MTPTRSILALRIAQRLLARNRILEDFFSHESARLAAVSQEMANRFLRGGRLLAFGRGACATDAQHVSVEFVHPVIVGKRALPALDLSSEFALWLDALVRPEDIVMGFAPPGGDPEVEAPLDAAYARGAMTLALPGASGSYWFPAVTDDTFINQELIEVLYHTLWETVHVFLEHRELGQDAGPAGFLYPFLGQNKHNAASLEKEVAESIRMKVREDARLRAQVAEEQAEPIAATVLAIESRLRLGGKLIFFGNGSSQPFTLAAAPETERLQMHDPSGVLGFNWGIDRGTPQDVHDARLAMRHPPPRLDHDALADTLVDRHTVYHFYLKSTWIVLEMQD